MAAAWAAMLLAASGAAAQSYVGRVVGVAEGDSLTVIDAQRRHHRIGVAWIDAPGMAQPFGAQSRASLAALVNNREVEVQGSRPDGRGRETAKILAADPNCNAPACPKIHDVGLMQVTAGMAWWDRRSANEQAESERENYEIAEFNAKLRRLGLWNAKNPVPPWEWR